MAGNDKKAGGGLGPVRIVILIVAIGVFCYSGFRLYNIFSGYKAADDEYSSLADEFTKPGAGQAARKKEKAESAAGESTKAESSTAPSGPAGADSTASKAASSAESTESEDNGPVITVTPRPDPGEDNEEMLVEDAEPPLEVNWEELKAVNPDIVGWLYVDAQDNISYPICRADDNDFYLHQTFRKQYLYAGSIFEDYHNNRNFTDPNTLVYGHNMRNGSMFGMLKYLNDQEKYDRDPFFWILTPKGNYRYHIFAIFTTAIDSDVYLLYSQNGAEFLEWEKKMQSLSSVKNTVPLSKKDKTVILSTCTSDSSARCVVIGKCVSSARPEKVQAQGVTTVTAPAA